MTDTAEASPGILPGDSSSVIPASSTFARDDVDRELEGIAGRIGSGRTERRSLRQLLELFGAKRRGANIVESIRSRLAKHGLKTEPDFVDAGPDDDLQIIQDGNTPYHLRKLREADATLSRNEQAVEVTVRQLLAWFGAARRGSAVVDRVRASLDGFDLETEPDFNAVHVDSTVSLARRETTRAADADEEAPASPENPSNDEPATTQDKGSPPSISDPTPRVGALIDPRAKELIKAQPGETLKSALTKMLAEQISYLPVLKNDYAALGIVRWREIVSHLALAGGSLDQNIEVVMQRDVSIVQTTDLFFDIIPKIVDAGYVLVRNERRAISGIITRSLLGKFLHDQTGPFTMLGEIEVKARRIAERGDFTVAELRALQLENDPREIHSVADLTLGQMGRLLENDANWCRLGLQVDRKEFMRRFHEVRQIRNDLMHFDPDSPSDEQKSKLANFRGFLREIERALPR